MRPSTSRATSIDLALRGGGGDNVTAIVIEAPQPPPSSTQVVRTNGAMAWWQRRDAVPADREGSRTDARIRSCAGSRPTRRSS